MKIEEFTNIFPEQIHAMFSTNFTIEYSVRDHDHYSHLGMDFKDIHVLLCKLALQYNDKDAIKFIESL